MSGENTKPIAGKMDDKSTSIKYHLVEAEEIESTATLKPTASRGRKKGKTNWSQFPLTDTNIYDKEQSHTHNHQQNHHNGLHGRHRHRGGNRGGRWKTGGSSGRNNNNNRRSYDQYGSHYNGMYVPNNDPAMTAELAVRQIEFYFSVENLVRDTFLRQHMDVDGYVPVSFIAGFQAVYILHQDYQTLLEALSKSEFLELDQINEKVRVNKGWAQWLWPNSSGGFGVPAYIKLSNEEKGVQDEIDPASSCTDKSVDYFSMKEVEKSLPINNSNNNTNINTNLMAKAS